MDIVLRATAVYFFVFLLIRTVGRRELSAMEPFDVFLLVVLGDLSQQAVTQSDMSVTGGMLAVATIALLTMGTGIVRFRFPTLRTFIDGPPIVLVVDGETVDSNLRRSRMTRDELLAAARREQIPSLDQVRWAVFESNGRISFIPVES